MAFDGFGTFLRLRSWVVDATNSVKIRADFHDDEDNNFAGGLSNCICKDGQTAITQNIPFNSRRIISLADPIDPQDAATKDYADTKMPLDGSAPITGDVLIKQDDPTITLDGKDGFKNSIIGQKGDKNRWELVLGDATAESGSNAGSNFDLISYADDGTTVLGTALFGTRSTALLTVKGDPTAALGIATKQYADATAVNAAASKVNRAGDTMTGPLQVNGELIAVQNYIRFGYSGGTIWHSGNFNPNTPPVGITSDVRLAIAGDQGTSLGAQTVINEPYAGAVITGWSWAMGGASTAVIWTLRLRYLQTLKGGTWFTVGYV
jgi:hypothetical protein